MPHMGYNIYTEKNEESEFDFMYCDVCKRYTTHFWVKSSQYFECEDCSSQYGLLRRYAVPI